MIFFIKHYIAVFLSPTPFISFILVLGVIFLWTRKASKIGPILVTTGVIGLGLFGFDPVTEYLLNQTEMEYPAFKTTNKEVKYVVVLAGGITPYEGHPLSTQLGKETLIRLVEGIKIHRQYPSSYLVLTGRGWAPERTEADAMKEMAMILGIPENKIITEEKSLNTFDHTRYLKSIIAKDPFVLVTSAIHMPRAMKVFTRAGYSPIPAPTSHILTGEYKAFSFKPFVKGDNLNAIDNWFFEFWARVKYL